MDTAAAVLRQLARTGQDLRYASRALRRAPLFSAVAILCLALGIASSTTMFSVFDAIVLRPLPFVHSEKLMSLALRDASAGRRTSLRYDEYVEWRRSTGSFRALAAHATRTISITEAQEPERVSARLVSANLFPLLSVQPRLGRLFVTEDDVPGAARVAIIGDALWRRRFSADSAVVGRIISLDGVSHTIVGVMEAGFAFPSTSELWMPIAPGLAATTPVSLTVSVVGRLREGVSARQATLEAAAIGARVAREMRASSGTRGSSWSGDARPLAGSRFGSDEAVISMAMLGATTFLLLIACANVANLMLVRAVGRERELAMRVALGAGRWRLIALLLSEASLISVAACAIALPVVWAALRLIKNAIPPSDPFPYYMEWSLDLHTFLFAAAASLATAVFSGLAPAVQATGRRLQDSLKDGGQGTGSGRRPRAIRNVFVVVEVALALVLLVGASLFVRTFVGLRRTELGYDVARIMTMRFHLAGPRYDSARARLAFVEDVLRRADAVPGVEAASVSDLVPLDDEGGSTGSVTIDAGARSGGTSMAYAGIAGRWFEMLGVDIAGRAVSAADQRGAPTAVVNRAMARALWPGESAIGRRFRFTSDSSPVWYEVIGVAPDIRTVKLDEDRRTPPSAFVPLASVPTRDYALLARAGQTPATLTSALRRAIHSVDPVVPVFNTWTMEEVRYLSFWMYVLWGTMFGVFGGIALLLATIGVYAVIHYGAAQRTREIGVRVALGAQRADVLRLVLAQVITLAGAGVGAGIVGAFALTRVVESLLIGVSATDLVSFVAVPLLLGGVAVVASYVPARRATRVDPVIALRAG